MKTSEPTKGTEQRGKKEKVGAWMESRREKERRRRGTVRRGETEREM